MLEYAYVIAMTVWNLGLQAWIPSRKNKPTPTLDYILERTEKQIEARGYGFNSYL